MGTSRPLPKKGAEPPPRFSAHFYCGQTAGCIKPLGMEVCLSPGDFVLDADQAGLPNFQFTYIVAKRRMVQDTTWYGGRPRLARHCVRWGPSSPSPKGAPPTFGQYPFWPNGWMDRYASLGMEVNLHPGDVVLDGGRCSPLKGEEHRSRIRYLSKKIREF